MKKLMLGFLVLLFHDAFLLAIFSIDNIIQLFILGILWLFTGGVLLVNLTFSKDELKKTNEEITVLHEDIREICEKAGYEYNVINIAENEAGILENKVENKKIKLKDFLALTRKNMFVDIMNKYGSEGALISEELLAKRPELEETYIQINGIECRMEKLDDFLSYNSELRKDEFFEGRKNEKYLYLLVFVED